METKIELLKEARTKTLEKIIEKFGGGPGCDFNDCKLSIADAREVIYIEIHKIAERIFNEEFK